MSRFLVEVPATTANLGPGFDCLGLALELTNQVEIQTDVASASVEVSGEGADELRQGTDNLVLKAIRHVFTQEVQHSPPPLSVRQTNRIPLGRGLGSSASAIVAGVLAADHLLGGHLSEAARLRYAVELEGHPDNVSPALRGGFTLSYTNAAQHPVAISLPFPVDVDVAVAIPSVQVSTEAARRALPADYGLADVSFTLARACLLVSSLLTHRLDLLDDAGADRIHTPYRSAFIPGFAQVQEAARVQGLMCFISGSGPTVAALARRGQGDQVADQMAAAFRARGVEARALALKVRTCPATLRLE